MTNTKYTLTQAEKVAKYNEERRQLRLEKRMKEAHDKQMEKDRKIIFTKAKTFFKINDTKKKIDKEDYNPIYIIQIG